MLKSKHLHLRETILPAILNSYSVIFFMNSRVMAIAILAASFLNFYAGLSGLIAVVIAVVLVIFWVLIKPSCAMEIKFQCPYNRHWFRFLLEPGVVFYPSYSIGSVNINAFCCIQRLALQIWFTILSIPFVLTFGLSLCLLPYMKILV